MQKHGAINLGLEKKMSFRFYLLNFEAETLSPSALSIPDSDVVASLSQLTQPLPDYNVTVTARTTWLQMLLASHIVSNGTTFGCDDVALQGVRRWTSLSKVTLTFGQW